MSGPDLTIILRVRLGATTQAKVMRNQGWTLVINDHAAVTSKVRGHV